MNWLPVSEITPEVKAIGPLFCRLKFSDEYGPEYHVMQWDASNERFPWVYVYSDKSLDARASESVVTHFQVFEEPAE
jgi:hypothetical protein